MSARVCAYKGENTALISWDGLDDTVALLFSCEHCVSFRGFLAGTGTVEMIFHQKVLQKIDVY